MIPVQYFDASVLLKVYVREPGSDEAQELFHSAPHPAASVLTGVEVLASLHRAEAGGRIKRRDFPQVLADFHDHWQGTAQVPLDLASSLALRDCGAWKLKGADALHLATCIVLRGLGVDVLVVCSDAELAKAARREDFRVHVVPAR